MASAAKTSENVDNVEKAEIDVDARHPVDTAYDSLPFKGATPFEVLKQWLNRSWRTFAKRPEKEGTKTITQISDLLDIIDDVQRKRTASEKLDNWDRFVMFFFGLDANSEGGPQKCWLYKPTKSFFQLNRKRVATLASLNFAQIMKMVGTFIRFAEKELPGDGFKNGKMQFAKNRGRKNSKKNVPWNYTTAFDYCVGAPPEAVYKDFQAKMIHLLGVLLTIKEHVFEICPEAIDASIGKKSQTRSEENKAKDKYTPDPTDFPALPTHSDPKEKIKSKDKSKDKSKGKAEDDVGQEDDAPQPRSYQFNEPAHTPNMYRPMPPPVSYMTLSPDGMMWGTNDGIQLIPLGYAPPQMFMPMPQQYPQQYTQQMPIHQDDVDEVADIVDDDSAEKGEVVDDADQDVVKDGSKDE